VFFVNLPVGVFAFLGLVRYLPESRAKSERLDMFGFISLSVAIGMFQMCLDRGEQLDWFDSWEIQAEAAAAVTAFAYFAVHTWTTRGVSFFERRLLKDRNFVTACLFAFVVGMILFSTMALLPTFLQGLLGYPVIYTGVVTAPRGIGTMLAMLLVGRLLQRGVDGRALMAFGLSCTAYSLYQMTTMTLEMDSALVISSGFIQGVGIGFTFVPLSTAAFATLAPSLRSQGTPIFSLLRNIGSSVGISIVQVLLTQGAGRAHARIAETVWFGSPALAGLPSIMDPGTPAGLALINELVTRQATLVAYLDDFHVMMGLTLMLIPLLLIMRSSRASAAVAGAAGSEPSADVVH
jgi:DHA2 family multidrug resistance protein